MLHFISQGKLIIAVEDNVTSMKVKSQDLFLKNNDQIITVKSYAEAAGYLLAFREGILFSSISPKVPTIPVQRLADDTEADDAFR